MSVDLAALPQITFLDADAEGVESRIITQYETVAGRSLAQGDPVRLFLESVAAVIVQQRELIDWSAKQNLLAYASGDYLDHLGAFLGVTRLPAAAALCTVRFSLSSPRTFGVLIPAGTRVTPDGSLMFSVTEAATIAAGDMYAGVNVECQTAGEVGNGFVAGQINQLVDPIAYIESVSNTAVSSGGADIESDTALRERVRLAPESFSVAGSKEAYEFWAKTTSPAILDVTVDGPAAEPGHVYIYPLMTGGTLPSQEVLDAVAETCSASKVRPLTDTVHVVAPTVVDYAIDLTYYASRTNSTITRDVTAAVDEYILWQRSRIGRDINPSELISRVMLAGATRVTLASPAFRTLTVSQIAIPSAAPTLSFGGFDDE